MAVHCRQVAEGLPDSEVVIAPHADDQTDEELLLAKANGATAQGWMVEWDDDTRFTATKVRWADIVCTRTFEIR